MMLINHEILQNQLQLNNLIDDVPRGTYDQIIKYIKLILKFNSIKNLVSRKSFEEVLIKNLIDSINFYKCLKDELKKEIKITDLGSGNGFPAIILAILGFQVELIEIDNKKVVFLEEVIRLLSLSNASVKKVKIGNSKEEFNLVITAKAFSSINNILNLLKSDIKENIILFLLKGDKVNDEIKEALQNFEFEYNIFNVNSSKIIKIYNIRKQ